MKIILTNANLYVEPGPKLIFTANSSEIDELAKKIERLIDFELGNVVRKDDGSITRCRFHFENSLDCEAYVVGSESIDLTLTHETAVRSVELLNSLKEHPNNAFQFVDLSDPDSEGFSVIVQLVK